MIIVKAELELSDLVDVFGNQLQNTELNDFAYQLVQENIGMAAQLRNHLEYYIEAD